MAGQMIALERRMQRKGMEDLPSELVQEMLSRLPLKSLFLSRYVCPSWRNCTRSKNDPGFAIQHYNKQLSEDSSPTSLILCDAHRLYCIADIDACKKVKCLTIKDLHGFMGVIEVVGSINGFLCLAKKNLKVVSESKWFVGLCFSICNPVSGDWFEPPDHLRRESIVTYPGFTAFYGFGYNSVNKEYKVVRLFQMEDNIVQAAVHTLGTDRTWRDIGTVPNNVRWNSPGFYFGGYLHWFIYNDAHMVMGIKVLSVEKEIFGELKIPDRIGNGNIGLPNLHLGKLGGWFMIADNSKKDLKVWVMTDYGVKETWVCKYVIPRPSTRGVKRPIFHPLAMHKGDKVLIKCCESVPKCMNYRNLYSYDPRTKTLEDLKVPAFPNRYNAFSHVGTLVKLKDVI